MLTVARHWASALQQPHLTVEETEPELTGDRLGDKSLMGIGRSCGNQGLGKWVWPRRASQSEEANDWARDSSRSWLRPVVVRCLRFIHSLNKASWTLCAAAGRSSASPALEDAGTRRYVCSSWVLWWEQGAGWGVSPAWTGHVSGAQSRSGGVYEVF